MSLNFNVDPYYDDFDQAKNFHRILFKPGRAVQARELTQSQTILQNQITKFADNIFKQNSPVTGGKVTTNFDCYYIKLQTTFNDVIIDVTDFDGLLIKNATGNVIARVVGVAAATGTAGEGDPPTLVVVYQTGNQFQDNDVIYDVNSNLTAQAIVSGATGKSSIASISEGVFYILGNFVQIQPTTIILDKYDNTPSKRIGLSITETIYDYINDPSLLDPAVGASNYQAPGADRYVIALTLDTRPIQLGDDQNFVELVRVTDGQVTPLVTDSVYNVIDDYFAKRDYETNGDYVVTDFKLTPRTNNDSSKYTLSVGKGLAYVHGYRTEVPIDIDLVSNRARTTDSENNTPIFIDYGSYFYVDTLRGLGGGYFDVTTAQAIDIHCVPVANIQTANANTYNTTLVASGYIRNLIYVSNSSDADTNTYIFKAFVNDLQNGSPTANAISGTTNTITLPADFSTTNDAYIGVNISITNGPSSGDFRTITSYNGTTRVATVNQNWSATPTSASVFVLNFDIKDCETIVAATKTSYPATLNSYAKISNYGKVGGLSSGDAILQNGNAPELIYRVGSPYVASISDASYTTQQITRGLTFTYSGGAASAQLNYDGSYLDVINHFGTPSSTLSSELAKQNFLVIVTNAGSSTFNVGDIVSFANTSTRTITLDNDASVATLSVNDAGGSFTATVLEKVFATNALNDSYLLRYKNLITANTTVINYGSLVTGKSNTYINDSGLTSTGQIYIAKDELAAAGQKQSLFISDVKRIVKIIDTKSTVAPSVGMLTSPTYDVTNNYIFDNGQRDNFYDHASITLRPGAPQPIGNLLVFVDYYQHVGGEGYFSLLSYDSSTLQENYQEIPSYTAKSGLTYALRDCLDFRPSRRNGTTSFQYQYDNAGDGRYGVFIPSDLTTFVTDYEFYLGRSDKLVLTKDGKLNIIEGAPSLTPLLPSEPDGSLVIANLYHEPYTGYIPTEAPAGVLANLSIEKVKHKRYTMQDIAGLETRINQIEYYTSLSLLEQKATTLQISDAYGLNRFKNGILVDDFSSFSASDTTSTDFNVQINRRERIMSASQVVNNYPLKSLAVINNFNKLDPTTATALGYEINTDGNINYFTLPYTTANVTSQKFASRTVNVNPFAYNLRDGVLSLTPNIDNWVDTKYNPPLLIVDPNLKVFQGNTSGKSKLLETTDWKTIPGTRTSTTSVSVTSGSNWQKTTTTSNTYVKQSQTSYYGAYDSIGNTYNINNGYITDISILPYIRQQEVVVRAKDMLYFTNVNSYFDGINVDKYFRKANIIELTGVSGFTGIFEENDVIGYYSSGNFYPTASVIGVYKYPGTNNVRLYVAGDGRSTTYTVNGSIRTGWFNTEGVYVMSGANGTLASTSHFGGMIRSVNSSTSIRLSGLASNTNNYYNSNTIYITSGTGAGQSATITAYDGLTQTATLSTAITVAAGDIYSIGPTQTSDHGSVYGVFCLPPNTFHNGQRTFRIDNSLGNPGAETTFSQSSFYAEGLQTVAQRLDFGASVAGASGVSSTTASKKVLVSSTTTSITNTWDPVAQTFILDKNNYPNGLFLNSVKFFFATKPTTDRSPITLSIVGTLNGYPTGEVLQGSMVTLSPEQVKTSSTPQYLDTNSSTTFTFSSPVYISSGVLYAFILKSNSNQYTLWTAFNGDTALASSVKNLPNDPTPSTITKIGGAPYVGSLFISQNSQTWTADQNQALMFVADRCVFSKTANPTIQFVVPKKLPQRTLIEQSIDNYYNANNVSSNTDAVSNTNIYVDAFNVTTTDFTPTNTNISYSYNSTLMNGSAAGNRSINPGKFGTPTPEDIFLNDGKGQRMLVANSNTSFSVYASLSTTDDAVSPIISDSGLSVYSITWNINNAELSNNLITLSNGGSGYNVNTTIVSISAPDVIGGSQAYAAANIANGVIQSVYLTSNGSGYITTPTVTITDANTAPGTGAVAIINGETDKAGGNITSKYITKKVTLDNGFDSGDLNVYMTAYRPVNSDIHVYYKILNKNDTQLFEDSNWQLMTKINNSNSKYSQSRDELIEYSFAPGTGGVDQGYVSYTSTNGQVYNTFNQFAIKVVLISSDHTYTPFIDDIRVIALPSNVNPQF